MRRFVIISLALLIAACAASVHVQNQSPTREISDQLQPYVTVSGQTILLKNATIHTGDGALPLTDHSILISGGIISAIGPSDDLKAPDGTTIIDLQGDSVMPGIVGMHNHLHMPGIRLMAYSAPRLYLAAGVTTIQTTGSADPMGELELTRAINAGEVPGPTIFPTAPYLTGPGGNSVMDMPSTEEEARTFVRTWADRGMTWFKIYRHTDPDIARIVIDEAHQRGLKVTGHLCSISYREAALMGIDSIEHGLNAASDFVADRPFGQCVPSRASKLPLDPWGPEIGDLIDVLVAENVTLTSTLAILESGFPRRPQAQERALLAMSPEWMQAYHERQVGLAASASSTSSTAGYWQLLTQFERRFVAAGGHLVAGPDPGRHILPGFGDQRNFELLVESGFSVPEVIQIMTHNGARALGIGNSKGLIRAGYDADLIVLSGDLVTNPSGIGSPRLIFKDGLGYDPDALIRDTEGQVGLR